MQASVLESVNRYGIEFSVGTENRTLEIGMMDGIGIILGLKAETVSLVGYGSLFADLSFLDEVAGIELYSGKIGIYFHDP